MARVGHTLFVHGSIGADIAGANVDDVNRAMRRELAGFDELKGFMVEQGMVLPEASIHRMVSAVEREMKAIEAAGGRVDRRRAAEIERLRPIENWGNWLFVSKNGPLWSRDAARWDDEERAREMAGLLENFGARRLVVGHTGQSDGLIKSRFGNSVWLVDTKMYKLPEGGALSALEILDGTVTAVYSDRRVELAAPGDLPPWSYRLLDVDGNPLPFADDDEVLEFLRTAEVVSIKPVGRGVTNPKKLVLSSDGVRAHAIFRDVNVHDKNVSRANRKFYLYFRDYYGFEVAAYELSRMLDLNRVPPAVMRRVDGQPGSVQIWLEDMIMDVDRRDLELNPPEQARWNNQRQMLDLFDNLIGNSDRNLGNVLIDRGWTLWFIDHSRCFVTSKVPLYPERITHCERKLWHGLEKLTDQEINERLGPYLSPFELETLIFRRDALLEHIRGLFAEHGEAAVLFDLPGPGHAPVEWPEE